MTASSSSEVDVSDLCAAGPDWWQQRATGGGQTGSKVRNHKMRELAWRGRVALLLFKEYSPIELTILFKRFLCNILQQG